MKKNLEWIGMAGGVLSDFGIETPIIYFDRYVRDGAQMPNLQTIKYLITDAPKTSEAVKMGALLAIGGTIGDKIFSGLAGRVSRGAEKFGTGLALGGILSAVIQSTQPTAFLNNPYPATNTMNGVYSP